MLGKTKVGAFLADHILIPDGENQSISQLQYSRRTNSLHEWIRPLAKFSSCHDFNDV